ncbi:MAG: tetratricopeptide repeat protein [Ignavibacteriaceae bacterium]
MKILSILIFLQLDIFAYGFFESDTSLALNYYNIADDFIVKAEYDSELFYLEKAEKIFYDNKMWNKYVGSLNRKSHSLRELGKFDSALVISKKSLEFGEKYCKDDKIRAQAYNQLGYSYKNLGDFESALLNAQKGEIILNDYSANKIKAENYSLLGQIYTEISEHDSSIYFFERAIETKIEIFGKDDHSISTEYNNMALTFAEKGDNEKAREYFFKSVDLKIKALGENHADVATLYSNIGANYFWQGENDLALEYYLKGLSIDLEILKEDHAFFGLRYNNIAMAYRVKGDFDKAIEYALKSEKIMINSYGEKHPYYATIINNIGRIYSDKKDFDNALQFFNSSYEIFKKSLGESHPATTQIQHNIGETYNKMGEYDKGLEFLKKSLATRLSSLGSKHPKFAATLIEVGKNFFYQSMPDSALYYFQQAIISSTNNFDEPLVEVNPDLSSSRHERELIEALNLKAETFNGKYSSSGNLSDLKNSLSTYNLASKLAVQMRKNYKSESSKFSIGQTGFSTIIEGISAANKLYDLTGNGSYLETAFVLIENGKAGILSDALADANAKNFSGIPDSHLEQERELRIDLANYDTQIQKEREKIKGIDSTKLLKLEDSFFNLHRKYENLIGDLEKNYESYYKLKYGDKNYTLNEIRNNLNEKSAILEYALSDTIIYIFLISKSGYSLQSVHLNNPLKEDVILFRNALYNIDFDHYKNSAYNLYSVLIKPVESKLENIEKLHIIPDGILNYHPLNRY